MRPLRNCIVVFTLLMLAPVLTTAQQSDGSLSPESISWPTYTQHGQELMIPVTVTNNGDAALTATISTLQLGGPSNWLAVDQASISVPASDQTVLTVTLNNSGVVNMPGQVVALEGWVLFDVDPPTATDSLGLFVQMIVADTIVLPIWDTIATSCLALSVGSNGNMGQQGVGGANMNFFGDCDDSDTIPGDASIYLYDASPVVFTGGQNGTWSMYTHQNAWYPIESYPLPDVCDGDNYQLHYSGQMLSQDSSLTMETAIYAPTAVDSCDFVIHRMRLYATDGNAKNDLAIGLLADWNIPSDSLVNNTFGVDPLSGVYWQQGLELDNDPAECQENDARFGGYGLIGYRDQNGEVLTNTLGVPGRAAEVASLQAGDGDLDPAQVFSLLTSVSGPVLGSPADLLTAATVFTSYNLAAGDTLEIWSVLASVENGSSSDIVAAVEKGRAWVADSSPLPWYFPGCGSAPTCCLEMGDLNSDGQRNLTDLTCLIGVIFLFDQCAGFCPYAADVNRDCQITLTDITLIVNSMFVTFVPLPECPNVAYCGDWN